MVTILSLREQFPKLFAAQTWFAEEPFASQLLLRRIDDLPRYLSNPGRLPRRRCPRAVQLVELYTRTPTEPLWHRFLWCEDTDRWGQRVFVGGIGMERGFLGTGFQIHRFVTFTSDWGTPIWD